MSIPDPIVLLDARAKYVHPAFQMTRASTKTMFDSTGKLVTVPANALGWDHDPATGQARGYLAEPSATNLLLNSNDLDGNGWSTPNASIVSNAITGPDGNGMAKLVENTSESNHGLYQYFTITDEVDVVLSMIAQAGERKQCYLYLQNGNSITQNVRVTIDLSTGTTRNATAANGATLLDSGVIDLGGGFYLVWLMGNLGAGVTNARVEVRLLDGNGNGSYQGDGTSGLYLGYCQAQEGSYLTSYIETGAATATRARDSLILSDLGDFPWWRSERGTLLVDVDLPSHPFSGAILGIDQNLIFRRDSGGRVFLDGTRFTAFPDTIISSSSSPGRHLIACAWDGTSIAISADGTITVTGDQTDAINESPNLGLGVRGNDTRTGLARIHRAVYYPARLSNADLQSLTAIQE